MEDISDEEERAYLMRLKSARHKANMNLPAYAEGFEAYYYEGKSRKECPYSLPEEVCQERLEISVIKGPLSEEQKARLRELNEIYSADPYALWVAGYYMGLEQSK